MQDPCPVLSGLRFFLLGYPFGAAIDHTAFECRFYVFCWQISERYDLIIDHDVVVLEIMMAPRKSGQLTELIADQWPYYRQCLCAMVDNSHGHMYSLSIKREATSSITRANDSTKTSLRAKLSTLYDACLPSGEMVHGLGMLS